jgi:hypothetical protein
LSDLDRNVKIKSPWAPHQGATAVYVKGLNNKGLQRFFGGGLPAVVTRQGSYASPSTKQVARGYFMFAYRVFSVTADVCESHPGECEVEVAESRWHEQANGDPPDAEIEKFLQDKFGIGSTPLDWLSGRMTPRPVGGGTVSNFVIGELITPPAPPCNKRIVVVDIPWNYSLPMVGDGYFVRTGALQTVSIYDKATNERVGWLTHKFGIGINPHTKNTVAWSHQDGTSFPERNTGH